MADPATVGPDARIDLAREPDFHLGDALVSPATCEIGAGSRRITLQHRVMQVLVALARSRREVVSRDALVARCWDGLAVSDDAINRCVQRLRRLAETEIPGAYVIETLPRIGYRLTPGAATGETANADPTDAPRRSDRFVRPLAVAVAATIAVAALAVAWLWLGPILSPPAEKAVLAVMPFRTAGRDPLEQSFANGVAEEVANALTKADLHTLNLEANLPADPTDRSAVAERLGARLTLDGLAQRSGGRLTLDVHLDDLQRRSVLWSARFDRPDTEAQAMQEQVAAKIAVVAHCALDAKGAAGAQLGEQSAGLYLEACDLGQVSGHETQVRDLLQHAVAQAPRFAAAWGALAMADVRNAEHDAVPADQAPMIRQEVAAAAHRALALDPKNAAAYAALIDVTPATGDWARREALIDHALKLVPDNPELLARKSSFLQNVGRSLEAAGYAIQAMNLDPLSPVRVVDASQALAGADQVDYASNLINRAARIWPDDEDIWMWRLSLLARLGPPDEALAFLDHDPGRPSDLPDMEIDNWRRIISLRKSRDPAQIDAYARLRLGMDPFGARVSMSVLNLSTVGANDAALQAATLSRPGNALDPEVLFRPYAAGMRRNPQFMRLAARFGLVAYWRSTGNWPDFCELPTRPYDCKAVAAKLGV